MLEADSENIIKQYEERLLKYQKTLEESNQIIEKHQKTAQYSSSNYEELIKKITTLYTITTKSFPTIISKETSEAVDELCEI